MSYRLVTFSEDVMKSLSWLLCAAILSMSVLLPTATAEKTAPVPVIDVIDVNKTTILKPISVKNSLQTKTENTETTDTAQKVTEFRRNGGQVYRLELKHSQNNIQYIEQSGFGADILLERGGISDIPNIPKWQIVSWD